MNKTVYLSLGSNVGEREAHLQGAISRLAASGLGLLRCSSVYETEPQDNRNQGWFLNLVLEAETELFPRQLLKTAAQIERDLGRQRVVAKGPRTLDIDILLFGRFVIQIPSLEVPHPRMHQRRFVLEPLSELAPDMRHPVLRRSIRELLAAVHGQTVKRVDFRPTLPDK